MLLKSLFILLVISSHIISQPFKIYLDSLTRLDGEGVHLVSLSAEAKEKLILPKISDNEIPITKKYLNLFYSWDTKSDENISALVYQFRNEDVLYIDKNNDNDLSNDGNPILFPLNTDSIIFSINSKEDSKQVLMLSLARKPNVPDSLSDYYLDTDGNLTSNFLSIAKFVSDDFNFEGKKRSFYFDDIVTLRRGDARFGDSIYSMGLFDYSNNGLYNDERDLLLIDVNKTGELTRDIPSNVFTVDDIFEIDGKNYKLSEIDKYGKYIVIEETKEKLTFHYLRWVQEQTSQNQKKGKLSSNFWSKQLVSMNGEKIQLSDFLGKYLFLNIWGEWCIPCINEIGELKHAYTSYKDSIAFLGILKIHDIIKAKNVIENNKIASTNTFISDEMIKEFEIKGYPTNILIFPDGESYIQEYGINRTFFEINIR
jgi:thiol-disulfide isomerase/thioredoxin